MTAKLTWSQKVTEEQRRAKHARNRLGRQMGRALLRFLEQSADDDRLSREERILCGYLVARAHRRRATVEMSVVQSEATLYGLGPERLADAILDLRGHGLLFVGQDVLTLNLPIPPDEDGGNA